MTDPASRARNDMYVRPAMPADDAPVVENIDQEPPVLSPEQLRQDRENIDEEISRLALNASTPLYFETAETIRQRELERSRPHPHVVELGRISDTLNQLRDQAYAKSRASILNIGGLMERAGIIVSDELDVYKARQAYSDPEAEVSHELFLDQPARPQTDTWQLYESNGRWVWRKFNQSNPGQPYETAHYTLFNHGAQRAIVRPGQEQTRYVDVDDTELLALVRYAQDLEVLLAKKIYMRDQLRPPKHRR
ncbi:MAG: hypothetical protein WA030_01120 [Candidatus Microsaccharimonas sp.]